MGGQNLKVPEMKLRECDLKGLFLIERDPAVDERGFFREIYRKSLLSSVGIDFNPVQANHSLSKTGVIRAIHADRWNKLVYPLTGKMFAAIVDLRPESPTFGKYEEFIFDNTGDNLPNKALFVPNGFGNSICAIEGPVNYIYLVDAYWTSDSSFAVNPLDPDIGVSWPVKNPIMKESDKNAPYLRDLFPDKFK